MKSMMGLVLVFALASTSVAATYEQIEWSPEIINDPSEDNTESKSLEELTLEAWERDAQLNLTEEQRLEREFDEAYRLSKPFKKKSAKRLAGPAKKRR